MIARGVADGATLVREVTEFLQDASLDSPACPDSGGSAAYPILLPYGRTAAAGCALCAVVSLFAALPIRVRVLHVREQEISRIGQFDHETRDEATTHVETAVGYLQRHGVAATAVVRTGCRDAVPELILAEAHSTGAGVIVMGARPRHFLASMFAGSTSRAVLREASCPVLMVRTP